MLRPAGQKPNLKTEAIAGVTTFFTMAYIVVVNPQILSADGAAGMAFSGGDGARHRDNSSRDYTLVVSIGLPVCERVKV